LDQLQNFVSTFGRTYYKLDVQRRNREYVELKKSTIGVEVQSIFERGSESVVPFLAGKTLSWEIGGWGHTTDTETESA
jgi:dihydroorotase